jgi:hypothetical protein
LPAPRVARLCGCFGSSLGEVRACLA